MTEPVRRTGVGQSAAGVVLAGNRSAKNAANPA